MKASPVLAVCFVFDAVRFVFEQFWFFGPALAAVYCTANVGGVVSTWSAGLLGTKTAAAVCGASATVVGSLGAPAIAAFGVVMAIAVGLFGWMTAGLMLMMTNARIFKENEGHALWFGFSLLISEVPIIGSLPALTGVTVKMYSTQIKKDKESLKKYEKETAAARLQEQNQQTAYLMQSSAAMEAQQNEQDVQEAMESEDEEALY